MGEEFAYANFRVRACVDGDLTRYNWVGRCGSSIWYIYVDVAMFLTSMRRRLGEGEYWRLIVY